MVASRWEPNDLEPYDGFSISKISYFHREDNFASFIIKVWTGPNASTQVLSQFVIGSITNQFNEVVLDTPIVIDASQELWFGYAVSHSIGSNPAGCDDGPAIAYKGDMISMDGVSWVSMSQDFGLDYNWNLAAFVTNSGGEQIEINAINQSNTDDLLGYNVYRNSILLNYTTQTNYLDEDLPSGTYEYYVTAVYDEGESDPSNTAVVYLPDPCYPPDSVIATATLDDYIEISIIPPDSGNYIGFNLYRDGTLIDMISAGTPAFVDGPMPPGIYEYCVSTVCQDGESETVYDTAQIFVQELLPPTDLEAVHPPYAYYINLYWNAPVSDDWLGFNVYYRNAVYPPDTFEFVTYTPDTFYVHPIYDYGIYLYFVTALYNQGESFSSDTTETEVLSNIEINNIRLQIIPNPATGLIQITSPEIIQSLILYTSFGQAIATKNVNSKSYRMDLGYLPKGIYLISVQTTERKFQERLIIR